MDKYDKYKNQAISGLLPLNFKDWGLAGEFGRTVAHVAAEYRHLPAGFKQWDLADEDGKTVAHVEARYGRLPANFSQWSIADLEEKTVLRTVCDCWDDSRSVAYMEKIMKRWEKERPLCKTDADWEVFKKELPEIYHKYAVNEVMPDVYDEITDEASHGVLYGVML
jgi:hypothetical protein